MTIRRLVCLSAALVLLVLSAGCRQSSEPAAGRPLFRALIAISNDDAATLKSELAAGLDPNKRMPNSGSPILNLAVNKGKTACVAALLEAGADPDRRKPDGQTALCSAGASVDTAPELVGMLLEAGADVNAHGDDGNSPLHWIAYSLASNSEENSRVAIVTRLLKAGANANARNTDGETPLHWVATTTDREIVQALINGGADVNARDGDGETALGTAAGFDEGSATLEMFRMLLKAGAKCDVADNSGGTALHEACLRSIPRQAAFLIEAGADVDCQDTDGDSPLHYAVRRDSDEMVELLIKHKARLDIRNSDGDSPLTLAASLGIRSIVGTLAEAGADEASWTPLHWAAARYDEAKVKSLIAKGVEVNAADVRGRTALFYSVITENWNNIQALVEAGADPNIVAKDKNSPLHEAARYGDTRAMSLLIEAGAKAGVADALGRTPAHLAVIDGSLRGVDVLLAAGADINARTNEGLTLLHVAVRENEPDMVKGLVGPGRIDVNARTAKGWTALHMAADKDDSVAVTGLQCDSLDANARTPDGDTALHLAVRDHSGFCVEELIEAGADPMLRNNAGRRPIDVIDGDGGFALSELRDAMKEPLSAILMKQLARAKTDTSPITPATTPRDAVRNFARAVYRADRDALSECFDASAVGENVLASVVNLNIEGIEFCKAMVDAYGEKGWLEFNSPKSGVSLVMPVIEDADVAALKVTTLGDEAFFPGTAFRGPEMIRLVKRDGMWRIDTESLIPAAADPQQFIKAIDRMTTALRRAGTLIGKDGRTPKDMHAELTKRLSGD